MKRAIKKPRLREEQEAFADKLLRLSKALEGAAERYRAGAAPPELRLELRRAQESLRRAERDMPIPYGLTPKAEQQLGARP